MRKNVSTDNEYKIHFLHHSTGLIVYQGARSSLQVLGHTLIAGKSDVPKWFDEYNKSHGTAYEISEQLFPKSKPYGWNNYPYDYYTIWVKHAGNQPYMEEPTLEILAKKYKMIIFKHCFPVGDISESLDNPDIDSPKKQIENYKLQYQALKRKMLEFPDTKFLLWTGAARVETETNRANAERSKAFFNWVRNEWDTANDNIYLFDFESLETDGGMYLKNEYAQNPLNSHPNKAFAKNIAPLFCQRIIDVIENNGTKTTLTGIKK